MIERQFEDFHPVVRDADGWRALVAVRSTPSRSKMGLVIGLHLRDPDGYLWRDLEGYRIVEETDPVALVDWMGARAEDLLDDFRSLRTEVRPEPKLPPGASGATTPPREWRKAFLLEEAPPLLEPVAGGAKDPASETGPGDDVVLTRLSKGAVAHPGYDYFMRPDTKDFSRAFARQRPWIMECGRSGDLMRALLAAGAEPNCGAGTLASVLSQQKGNVNFPGSPAAHAIRSLDAFHEGTGLSAYVMLTFLTWMPASWAPRNAAAYAAAGRIADASRDLFRKSGGSRFRTLLADCRGRWTEYAERLEAMPACGHGLRSGVVDVQHVVRDFSDRIVSPLLRMEAIRPGSAPAVASSILLDGVGLATVLRRSDEWHRRHRVLPGLKRPTGPWEALTEPFEASDGTKIVFLVDAVQLVDEGAVLRHCVGSYATACVSGETNVASVRAADGRRLSTIEVETKDGAAVVVQHRGRRNAPPPPEAEGAVVEWTSSVSGRTFGRRRPPPRPEEAMLPEEGSLSDWKGILPARYCRMSWAEMSTALAERDGALRRDGTLWPYGP